jgi:hypothetical protein
MNHAWIRWLPPTGSGIWYRRINTTKEELQDRERVSAGSIIGCQVTLQYEITDIDPGE